MTSSNDDIRRATETLRAVGREGHPDFDQDPVGAALQTLRDFATVVRFREAGRAGAEALMDSRTDFVAECYDESAESPLVKGGQGRELKAARFTAGFLAVLAMIVALGIAWALSK